MLICNRLLDRIMSEAGVLEDDWDEIEVPSKTEAGKVYVVAYSPYGQPHSTCDCEGYIYRDYCSHIKRAHQIVNCDWTSNNAEVPTPDGGCPWCGSPVVEVSPRK